MDAQVSGDMRDRPLRLEHQPHRPLTQLIGVLPRSRHRWSISFGQDIAWLRSLQDSQGPSALDWNHIDLDNNLIQIERSWDRSAGFIPPKSRSGTRRVPLTNSLRTHLQTHRLQQGSGGRGLVFPNTHGHRPFNPSTINQRAKTAWTTAQLQPITLHECRHTYAAYMIAAGINTKALSTYMGHASITITLDRYGHLLPGNEHQAANLLDTWLEQAKTS
jgi:integrase